MTDSTGGLRVQQPRTAVCPQRYMNDADLGTITVSPGGTAFSSIVSVEGWLDATLQAFDNAGGTAYQFIELAVQVGSESDGFVGGAVVQVIAAAGWMLAPPAWSSRTWSFARVRPVARRIRLRFRHTNGAAVDDFQPTLRLMLRGAPNRARLRVSA